MSAEFPIIEKLGGREAVYEEIREACALTTSDAIRMWTQRRSIPGKAVTVLWRIASKRGIECSPADFELESDAA